MPALKSSSEIACLPVLACLLITSLGLHGAFASEPVQPLSTEQPIFQPSVENFTATIGKGRLHQVVLIDGESNLDASITALAAIEIKGEAACQALSLKTAAEVIVTVATCQSGNFYLCPGGENNCSNELYEPTTHSQTIKGQANQLTLHNRSFGTRYVVEFLPQQFIYRIQEKSCLISYPHGCLINGFSWEDNYSFSFSRDLAL